MTERTFKVKINDNASEKFHLKYGVPQGSVIGPILFSCYTATLHNLLSQHDISFHCYADDTQLWLPVNLDDPSEINQSISKLENALEDISTWLTHNKLKLNPTKTKAILFSPKSRKSQTPDITIDFCGTKIKPSINAANLGVTLDQHLSLDTQINNILRSSYFHLRRIRSVTKYLPPSSIHILVHAFITSKLDNNNSLLFGLPATQLARLQKVQNAAARLLTATPRSHHITPILQSLHWLKIPYRIQYKLLIQVFKCIHSHTPHYLTSLITINKTGRTTRQSTTPTLVIPRVARVHQGERSFSYAAPTLWNALPPTIRSTQKLQAFKVGLKTHLYAQCFLIP